MVRFRRELSEKHKFIFFSILNLQILLVFGAVMVTLVLLEAKVVGNVGNGSPYSEFDPYGFDF